MMLARDPAVPRRDELLDAATVARVLGVVGCERTYAKYRVGESLRVVHRTDTGARIAGRSFPDAAAAYARARTGSRGVVHAPALDAVLWTFPNDRRITALPLLAGPSGALDRMLGRRCAATRLVAYAAEQSATAACLDTHGRLAAFAKVHAGEGAVRERRATESVRAALSAADPHLRVPHVLGSGDVELALEPLPGRRLDGLPVGALDHALERLGAALATLHGLQPPEGAHFRRLAPERMARAAGAIGAARPAAQRAAAELLGTLLDRDADAVAPAVCVHGDANLRNALLDGDRVSLIDLEDVAAGPAAADLGQVLAGLVCARVAGTLPAAAAHGLARALVRGYAAVAAPPPREALAWHTAASILARRALTAVNRVREPELRHVDAFLREAGALVR